MADVVADHLEREVGIDQPLDASVAKRMRASARDRNPRFAKIMAGAAGNRGIGERDARGDTAEKEVTIGRLRSAVLEVIDYGVAYNRGKRIGSGVIGLPFRYMQSLALPVDMIEHQRGNLPSAQAVRDQQQQNRVIASADRHSPLNH